MTIRNLTRFAFAICLCVTAGQLSAQYVATAVANDYAANDISSSGTSVTFDPITTGHPGDAFTGFVSFPTGFQFPHFGELHDGVWVNSCGFVSFDTEGYADYWGLQDLEIPNQFAGDLTHPNNAVYACHTSLFTDPMLNTDVWTQHLTGPDRFVIHWEAHHVATSEKVEVVLALFADGSVEVHFGPGHVLGATGTHESLPPAIGMESIDGVIGVEAPGGFRQTPTATTAYRFEWPTVDLDVSEIHVEGPHTGPNDVVVSIENRGSQAFTGNISVEYAIDGGVPVSRNVSLSGLASYAVHTETFSGADAWDVQSAGEYTIRAVIVPPVAGDPDAVDELSHDVNFDERSYYKTSKIANDYASNDISATGTAVPFSTGGGISTEVSFPTGFEFPYYGLRYDKLSVATYGFVSFGPEVYSYDRAPDATLPQVSDPNTAIYGCQMDLETDEPGQGVWTEHLTGPDRFVIHWIGNHSSHVSQVVEMTMVLYPDGSIETHFGPNTNVDGIHVGSNSGQQQVRTDRVSIPAGMGIENADATEGCEAPGGWRQRPTPDMAYRWDLPAVDLDVTDVFTGPTFPPPVGLNDVNVVITNQGSQEFSGSVDVEYQVGGGTPVGQTVSISALEPGDTHTAVFTGNDQWDATAGYHLLHGRITPVSSDPDNSDEKSVQIRAGIGNWTNLMHTGHWAGRIGHASVVFNNKIWVMGGSGGQSLLNDVWSFDGTSWTQETAAAQWEARGFHKCAVFNGRIWLTGGGTSTSEVNDVWSTADGVNWVDETATTPAPWDVRSQHELIEFNGELWLIGGSGGSGAYRDDVWSFDGTTWTQELADAPWGYGEGRATHRCEVLDGRLWIIGGTSGAITESEVWSSPDGVNWTLETTQAPSVAIGQTFFGGTTTAVFNKRIWIMGGLSQFQAPTNEVWSSSDGVVWMQESVAAPWSERIGHSAVVKDDLMWLLGGYTWAGPTDEVWTYIEAPSIISPPVTVANAEVPYTYDIVVNTSLATLTASGLPSWLSFSGSTLSGTPQAGDMGMTGTITITATNSEGSYDQEFQIEVQGQPPQITSTPSELAIIGEEYTYTVAATGIPAPTFSAVGLPAWLSFDSNTGVLSGTPSSEGMTGTISIIATNGWGTDDVQTFRIEVPSRLAQSDGDDNGGGCVATTGGTWTLPAAALAVLFAFALAGRRRRGRETKTGR